MALTRREAGFTRLELHPMSLWTPSGEHPVDRRRGEPQPSGPPPQPGDVSLDDLPPEERARVEEMARQMEEAQARMLALPAGAVVGQQALQFYELAAVYLSQEPPRLDDARVAIDALLAVVDKLGARLDQAEQPLRQAVNQLQMAYVQVAGKSGAAAAGGEASGAAGGDDPQPEPQATEGEQPDEAGETEE
jgi:hypothetical protein